MLALTITQPWAQLIVDRRKRWETRSWRPPQAIIGSRIAIHAAKGWTADDRDFARDLGYHSTALPRGAIVATVILEEIRRAEDVRDERARDELELGDFSGGRWAWFLSDIIRFPVPIATRGSLGLWEWKDWS